MVLILVRPSKALRRAGWLSKMPEEDWIKFPCLGEKVSFGDILPIPSSGEPWMSRSEVGMGQTTDWMEERGRMG